MAFAYKFESAELLGSTMTFLDLGIGDAVLLGHSCLWDAEMWRPQIDVLARRYRVLAPNLWGQGGSGPSPAGSKAIGDLAHHHPALGRLGIARFAVRTFDRRHVGRGTRHAGTGAGDRSARSVSLRLPWYDGATRRHLIDNDLSAGLSAKVIPAFPQVQHSVSLL